MDNTERPLAQHRDAEPLDGCSEITAAVGIDFFHLLNRHLAKRLNADSVYVAEIPLQDQGRLQTLAAFGNGESIPDYSYVAVGTPCEKALADGLVVCRGDFLERFPNAFSPVAGLRSFLAISLQGCSETPIGVLALGWVCESPDIDAARQALQTIINRVSAELQRIRITSVLEEQLHFTQEMLDAIPIPVFYKDIHSRYLGCNREFENALGCNRTEIVGKTVKDVASSKQDARYTDVDRQVLSSGESQTYDGEMLYDDGSVHEVVFNKAVLRDSDNRISGIIGTMFDVSELKNAEQMIHRLANYDPLTGLPNRQSFISRLDKAITSYSKDDKSSIAVLCFDLDNFKSLENTLEGDSYNKLLQEISDRITRNSRGRDIYARISNDRFAVALLSLKQEQDAGLFARRILSTLVDPVHVGGQDTYCSGSLGIALFPQDESDASRLLGCAEVAMGRARKQGGNSYQHFSKEINKDALERLVIEAGLRRSLAEGGFELYYQPQVDLRSRELIGTEALLRWTHPKLGPISPDRCIPIAEESGLIIPLGEWVLRTACRQNAAWQAAGYSPIRMAVNLSGCQLHQKGFVRLVDSILKETGLDPKWLELELTESTMMEKSEKNIEILLQLKKLGVNLSIDDFGTGYSSLSYLQRFPLDKLKIDRSFVKNLHKTESNAAITDAIIAMANRLGLKVLAEGIETIEQLDYLADNDCFEGQGYFFGYPIPGDEFEQHLCPDACSKVI